MSKIYNDSYKEDEDVLVLDEIETGRRAQLIVYNDDLNSFDWVIKSFQEVLRHTSEQAEQLAVIIHSKGKATVKTATMSVLKPKKEALIDRGLSAVIEEEEV